MNVEKERADFEVWAFCNGYSTARRTEDETKTSYLSVIIDAAWQGWLASAAVDRMPPLIELPESPDPGETERECFETEWDEHAPPLIRDPETLHEYANIASWCWLFWQARAALDRETRPEATAETTPPTSD